MNRFAVTALLLSMTTFTYACTNDDNKSKSAGGAVSSIQNPSGSFGGENAAAAFGRYGQDKKASNGLSSTNGGASGSSSTQSHRLRVLADTASGCHEGASCACEGGGSFVASKKDSEYGPSIEAHFDACVFADGNGFDGDMVLIVSQKPLLENDKLGDKDTKESLLLGAEGTFTSSSEKIQASVVFLAERGVDYLAVEVQDGKIVIGVRESDGAAVVYAKDTLWVCTPASGDYTCEEQNTGKKVNAPKSDSGATPKKDPAPSDSTQS